ncbi:trypsin-like peptidase domain-containing protein [Chloroflexota bacterium]
MITGIITFRSVVLKMIQRPRFLLLSLIVTFILILGALTGCSSTPQVTQPNSSDEASNPISVAPITLYDDNAIASLYERTIPAVVKIVVVVENETSLNGPFQRTGQGSGFIIDQQGHVLTNNHVVENASSVKITLHDGSVVEAEVLGTDRENDLALLETDPVKLGDFATLPLGNSDEIKPGQMAIALGSPFGLEGSITVGVISGIGRSLPSEAQRLITDIIQTDAAINPGNSGGPLLNSRGEVIGINTAIEPSATRIGFAVPINTAKSLLPALMEGGEVSSAWLGIQGMAINDELSSELDLPIDRGVYIIEVIPGSPAEEAGLRGSGTDERGQPTFGGDAVINVDGQVVDKVEDLISYFNGKKPGDEVSFSLYRGEDKININVTLGEWPQQFPTP